VLLKGKIFMGALESNSLDLNSYADFLLHDLKQHGMMHLVNYEFARFPLGKQILLQQILYYWKEKYSGVHRKALYGFQCSS
jgi:hypothetical protein